MQRDLQHTPPHNSRVPLGQQIPSKHTPAQQVLEQTVVLGAQQRLVDGLRQIVSPVQQSAPHAVVPSRQVQTGGICVEQMSLTSMMNARMVKICPNIL